MLRRVCLTDAGTAKKVAKWRRMMRWRRFWPEVKLHPMRMTIVLWLAALVLLSPSSAVPKSPLKKLDSLIIEGQGGRHSFSVEIADTEARQARGLMFRRSLPRDQGMLFLYRTEASVAMWMKNTYLPLDMLFIAGDGRVVHIVERTVPMSTQLIGSNGPASAVLEVVGGTVSRLGIALGDRVIHPAFGKNR